MQTLFLRTYHATNWVQSQTRIILKRERSNGGSKDSECRGVNQACRETERWIFVNYQLNAREKLKHLSEQNKKQTCIANHASVYLVGHLKVCMKCAPKIQVWYIPWFQQSLVHFRYRQGTKQKKKKFYAYWHLK